MRRAVKTILLSLCLAADGLALGQARYVETVDSRGSFPLVQAKAAAAVYVDNGDHAGVVQRGRRPGGGHRSRHGRYSGDGAR
jgi:hypothetical protein